jgi:hypothetical protein
MKKEEKYHYPIKAFRLSKDTIAALNYLKIKSKKSYNLLFLDMIATYQKYRIKKNK